MSSQPRSYPHVQQTTRQIPRSAAPHGVNSISRESLEEMKSQAAEHVLRPSIETSQKSFSLILNAASAIESGDDKNPAPEQQRSMHGPRSSGPRLNQDGTPMSQHQLAEYNKALDVWNSMVFVRSDFFSAEEAMAYVEYFYDQLQSMTPVVIPDYRHHTKHQMLLTEEPILALTILTIASRHMRLSGFSELSRRYHIHENLWRSLTSKVQRLLWGQEQFGGGRSAVVAGKVRELAGGQLTWTGSLRTFGTIEALLVLTDWQPRALHFPPSSDDIRLLDKNFYDNDDQHQSNGASKPGQQYQNMHSSWMEPAWRSDRMSWMLLGLAHSLSYELGVFDKPSGRATHNDPDLLRKTRIRRMVTVYLSQTSGRIGIPSPVNFEDDYTGRQLEGPGVDKVDIVHGLWMHIAGIMHSANKLIFPSREYTMNLVRSTEYRDRIQLFAPQLTEWSQHFDRVKRHIGPIMQCILYMEFEYARLYINSLGLQHVVESWVRPGSHNHKSNSSDMSRSVAANKKYIDEFTAAALHILEIVSVQMKDYGILRDAPVRTFLRTLSAMMFTIKRLSLGNHERMVRSSIVLLEEVIKLFQSEVVDDVHLSGSTAMMIEGILKKVKQTMIRVQKPLQTSSAPSRDASRAPSPQLGATQAPTGRTQELLDAATFEHNMHQHNPALSMDPLANIQGRPLAEFSDRTFIMPNGWSFNEFDGHLQMDDTAIDQSVTSDNNADWLAMPLDNINGLGNIEEQSMHSMSLVGQSDMLQVLMENAPGYDESSGMGWNNASHFPDSY
jgi:hypothetical protein